LVPGSRSTPAGPGRTTFSYEGHRLQFELLRECSVSRHLATTGTFYELPFLQAIGELLPAETVAFDVGAHIGNHTIYFAGVLGWRVVAFEPNPEAFEKLVANVEANGLANRVTCFQVALTDSPGTLTLARTEASDAGTVAVVAGDKRPADVVETEGATLDSYADLAGQGPTLLKIDVEGHELPVIEGGRRFLTRVAPHVTTEVQSVHEFEDLMEALGHSHRPSGIFNPTPTILWVPGSARSTTDTAADLIRYGIRAQVSYNEAHRRSLRTRHSIEAVQSIIDDTSAHQPSEIERAGLMRLRDQLTAAGEIQQLAGKRLLIIAVGECRVPAAAISALARAVDLIEVGDNEPRSLTMSRYVGGRRIAQRVATSPPGNDHLGAAQIELFVETANQKLGVVGAAAVIGGEGAPELADSVVDLLGVPYIHVALDPVYLPRRLPRVIGASASFVSSPVHLADWDTRHIVPARVLDPEDPMSMVGGISHALPRPVPARRADDGTDHRLLLVSYYSPPTKTVAIQRLAYWKDHLASIAAGMGISLTVDWLSATNRSPADDGSIYVADRGQFQLPRVDWEKLRELQDLDLDVIGATWSHYVRESLSDFDQSYDSVLISGNPFYYFDLARSFRESWGCKVALDFRDPWARQERFHYSVDQRAKLIDLENDLVSHADWVVSVNQECLDAIAPTVTVPRVVVANGFDETIVDAVQPPELGALPSDHRIQIVYAGTVYATLPLDDLLDALSVEHHKFIHFGRDYSRSQAAKTHPVAQPGGLVTYEELISNLKASDAGIVMTTGEPTMSTTKIFDYVACDLDLIILTKGRPRTGLLHELTSDLEGVYWVRDDPLELESFFQTYRPERLKRKERLRFSRREQAKRLLEMLYEPGVAI
jgi:FkbM family methyltransferase